MHDRCSTLAGAIVAGLLLGGVALAVGVPLLGAAAAGLLFALVSGLLVSILRDGVGFPTTPKSGAKAMGFAAALVGANLIGDCTIGAMFGPSDESLIDACTGHWPFLVTAFCFVPILGLSVVAFVRLAILDALRREG
jgi:hypothetical protein